MILQVLPIMSDFKLEAVLPGNAIIIGIIISIKLIQIVMFNISVIINIIAIKMITLANLMKISRHSTSKGLGRETKKSWLLWLSLSVEK